MGTPVNDKGGAHLTVIGHSITLDEILEAYYVSNCLLGEPDFILVARYSAFLSDLQTPPLLVMMRGLLVLEILDVNLLLQQRSNVA